MQCTNQPQTQRGKLIQYMYLFRYFQQIKARVIKAPTYNAPLRNVFVTLIKKTKLLSVGGNDWVP